jgi:hypothetical protein
MDAIIAAYPQLEFAIPNLLDMVAGPIEFHKEAFDEVLDELQFRLDYPLAWKVQAFLLDLVAEGRIALSKKINHRPSPHAIDFDLTWIDASCDTDTISVRADSIVVNNHIVARPYSAFYRINNDHDISQFIWMITTIASGADFEV